MCITQDTCFRYKGKIYATELEAVTAALQDIGARLFKDFATNPLGGLLELGGDISSLRDRHRHLTAPAEPAFVISERDSDGDRYANG